MSERALDEFWVMRVVQQVPRSALTDELHVKIQRAIESGELAVVGGEICEPIEMFHDQERAMAKLAELAKAKGVYKLVLNSDVQLP